MSIAGPLISAGANIAGGLIAKEAQEDANERAQNNYWTNYRAQMDAAQHGIRWKVDDAKDAGIHPLYALGASTMSFAPQSVGTVVEDGFAKGIAAAGQDISRAVDTTRTGSERVSALAEGLMLERSKLQNDLLRDQLVASKLSLLRSAGARSSPPQPDYADVPLPRPRPDDLPYADSDRAFAHPEGKKPEDRPPLMLFGGRVLTPSGTSPMKAWEDQIGDDGPLSWLAQLLVGSHLVSHNISQRFPENWSGNTSGRSRAPSPAGGRRVGSNRGW